MFLNHDAAFTTFTPAILPSTPDHTATLTAQTRLETPKGWCTVDTLSVGDRVATMDGGFAAITAISRPKRRAPLVQVPGGVLSTCSDVALPADARVALSPPARWSQAPVVSAPVKALSGWRGIRPTLFAGPDLATLHFEDEEMIYAQTGLLIHACDTEADSFFPTLSYGDTRALLALMDGRMPAPDAAAA
ncbi:MAG: Hint domain-containing protein [Pseudomonadota bacterium]